MARKAARAKGRKSKTRKRPAKRAKFRRAPKAKARRAPKATTKKRAKRPQAKRERSVSTPVSSPRNMNEPIPAQPAGRIGMRRPPNKPKMPAPKAPRELAQAEPDARFGDAREPEANAREHPDGSMPPMERKAGYKNTDEGF